MPGQNIILKGMTDPRHDADKEARIRIIGERYHKLKESLKKYEGNKDLRPLPFNSGYFMSFWTRPDAEDLRKYLLANYQTGIIRSDAHHIRIAFSSVDTENIEGLVDTVYKAASEL